MQRMSSLDFYQTKSSLKPGEYLIVEYDETEVIAVINDCECVCVNWLTIEEHEIKKSLIFLKYFQP